MVDAAQKEAKDAQDEMGKGSQRVGGASQGRFSAPQAGKQYKFVEVEGKGDRYSYYLKDLPHEDKKYLRLFFEVLERFPREDFKHEERQIEVLEQIRDRLT